MDALKIIAQTVLEQRHKETSEYIAHLVFSVHTVSYGTFFFPALILYVLAWAMNSSRKKNWSVTYNTDLKLGWKEVWEHAWSYRSHLGQNT